MKLRRPVPLAELEIDENADAALGRLESLVMPDWHRCNDPDCTYPACDCWERKEHRPLLDRHKDIGKFYGVDDYAALVDAQHRQIEKLQDRARKSEDGKPPILLA